MTGSSKTTLCSSGCRLSLFPDAISSSPIFPIHSSQCSCASMLLGRTILIRKYRSGIHSRIGLVRSVICTTVLSISPTVSFWPILFAKSSCASPGRGVFGRTSSRLTSHSAFLQSTSSLSGARRPELGLAFLGSQGDVWDAQKDMGLAGLGAVIAMTIVVFIHIALDRNNFWVEFKESFSIKPGDKPLGEVWLKDSWNKLSNGSQ